MRKILVVCPVLLLALLVLMGPTHARPAGATTVTVSGTITGPGGLLVDNVWIGVGSETDWQEMTAGPTGVYSLAVETDGNLHFHVRPELIDGLAQINSWVDGVSGDVTQDFTLEAGHLLSLQVLGSGGQVLAGEFQLEVQPLAHPLPENMWFSMDWDDPAGPFRAVLPEDIYYIRAHRTPDGYHRTTATFDLRSSDVTGTLPLNMSYVHPIPYEPPDVSRISFGPVDKLGEASVSGSAGAVLPFAHVLLVNLNSAHQASAVSEADGSFSAKIFAPPGSDVMIKHGPPMEGRWRDLDVGVAEGVNPFPGTIIHIPHAHAREGGEMPFAAVGGIEINADDVGSTVNYVGAAWAITGTLERPTPSGAWTRVLTGTYDGEVVPGLYLGGLNWTRPALGDLDDDGDLELLVGEAFGDLVLYRNQGSTNTPDWQFETRDYAGAGGGGSPSPALRDVTGDGAPDLFLASGSGTLSVFYNQGTPGAPAWPTSPDQVLAVGGNPAPALEDLDEDGVVDLIVGTHQEGEGGRLAHFANTGTITEPVWILQTDNYVGIAEAGGDGIRPAFVDLDGDGDRDMLAGLSGSVVWYERGGTVGNPTWTRNANDPIGYGSGSSGTSPTVGDWDGDGDEDLIIGEHWGSLRFFRDNGSSWAEETLNFPFDLGGDSAPALADWNGDGTLDMLVGQAHGTLRRYVNQGDATRADWGPAEDLLTLPWTNHPHPYPAFADIDADGDTDIFVGEGNWNGPEAGGNLRFYRNEGTPAAPDWNLVTASFLGLDVGGWSTPVFADIDADGDLDLFIGDSEGTLTFVENTGTAASPTWAAAEQPYADLHVGPYAAPAFFDLDQDCDLDLLVGQEDGWLAYVRNDGTPSGPSWELVTMHYLDLWVGSHAVPAAADLDGDGFDDLVIGEGSGGINVYRYAGPGTSPASGNRFGPGDELLIKGTLSLHGPAITATTDLGAIDVIGGAWLMKLFAEDGRPLPAQNTFMSSMLTPSGFPIQRPSRTGLELDAVSFDVTNLRYDHGHRIVGDLRATAVLPDDLSAGVYRPVLWVEVSGVPTDTSWLAANVVRYTFSPWDAPLPPITVGEPGDPRLMWQLLMDDFVQGTYGTSAREDQGAFGLASEIVSQGAPYYAPPIDVQTGQPITYRMEPFLPMISFTDRRMATPPLLPFELPGGALCVTVEGPDGGQTDLGCEAFAQSFNRTKTTRGGHDLNSGTVQIEDVYSLKAAADRFRVAFGEYGHHVVTMTGVVSDVWGNGYVGGGTYDVWIAHPLDIDAGVLPGTPLAVGDAFNPSLQLHPRVPADVRLTLTHYPGSDLFAAETYTISGRANRYGFFSPLATASPITLSSPGEYRVDLTATYIDASGEMRMGSMTWGAVVMTPEGEADLVAHGRRGVDFLSTIPNHWFVSCRDLSYNPADVGHTFNPYYNGDILWSRMSDGGCGGDSLLLGASVQDTVGTIANAVWARMQRQDVPLSMPGTPSERFAVGEIPLFISTLSGQVPQLLLGNTGETLPDDIDQIAYSYRSSQRPGTRVREFVAEDGETGGYWRLDTLYDDQLSVGLQGDRPNDFKFQYVGAVFRDLSSGHSEYLGQGTGWVFIPDDDSTGTRVMPPFAGPGNGGWTTEGGPILTVNGEDVHIFILPTGTRPGAVLQVGDLFRFAGHVMPTLDSRVAFTVTAPSGGDHIGGGRANSIGYYYDPEDDFVVDEPGLWTVDVRVWHDGQCSAGSVLCALDPSQPCPEGDVLGSEHGAWSGGRYWFYVVDPANPRLDVTTPSPGFLSFDGVVEPIIVSGGVPSGLSGVLVDYTISMPGFILEHGEVVPSGGTYEVVYDPAALNKGFPNLDLTDRDDWDAGLADTVSIGLLLRGTDEDGAIYRANTVTIQGEQVFVGDARFEAPWNVYLPVVLRSG